MSGGALSHWYAEALNTGLLAADPAQQALVLRLQQMIDELASTPAPQQPAPGLGRLLGLGRSQSSTVAVRGLYLWGGVGRGKTLFMDRFFALVPVAEKRRSHFHEFMRWLHDRMKELKQQRDPLPVLARQLAAETRLLCFDEFQVNDIADAMLLGRLMGSLFEAGVTLVATSNTAPDDLYRGGLQRGQFLPAIAAIKRSCDVLELVAAEDYRLRALEQADVFLFGDERAETKLLERFQALVPDAERGFADTLVEISGRPIKARAVRHGVIWFDFEELCTTARSAADYLAIARRYGTVILDGVPQLDATQDDAAVRFIHLVDALYDHGTKLLLSAAVDLESLYTGKRLGERFQRTRSRLEEMQSHEYLELNHRP